MPAAWRERGVRARRPGGALILFPGRGGGGGRRAGSRAGVFEAVLALLGYLHGTRSLYQVARALRLSQYTASGLLLLSVGTLVAWPQGTALECSCAARREACSRGAVLAPILTCHPARASCATRANAWTLRRPRWDCVADRCHPALAALLIFTNARVMDRLDVEQRWVAVENERLAAEARQPSDPRRVHRAGRARAAHASHRDAPGRRSSKSADEARPPRSLRRWTPAESTVWRAWWRRCWTPRASRRGRRSAADHRRPGPPGPRQRRAALPPCWRRR